MRKQSINHVVMVLVGVAFLVAAVSLFLQPGLWSIHFPIWLKKIVSEKIILDGLVFGTTAIAAWLLAYKAGKKRAALIALLAVAAILRVSHFIEVGKDETAYISAVVDFLDGKNPYLRTIESFENVDDTGGHGYAYFPGFLYINIFFFSIHLLTTIPLQLIQKLPTLLADLGIGVLLIKELRNKNYTALICALLFWYLNPYFLYKRNYVYFDPIPVFIMMLSLYYLKKDDVISGAFYGLAILFKTFPVILLPIFLMQSKKWYRFLAAGSIVGLVSSIPFLNDVKSYLTGAVFVHTSRVVQGRPFLFFISYFYKVELFQIIPLRVYSTLATFAGWVAAPVAAIAKFTESKYALSIIPFALFYLFTPVLNRTYLMWSMPIVALGLFEQFYGKNKAIYYAGLAAFWIFYYWYISIWKDGFHIWRP